MKPRSWAATPVAALLVAFVLGGCAAPQSSRMLALSAESSQDRLPRQVLLHDTPFFAQEDYQCGPAALAMVMRAAGVDIGPDALVSQVYLPERQGSLQAEMLAATRRQGLLALPLAPRLEDLLLELAAGHPVVVLQNLSLPVWPRWHYAVAIGYDLERREITLRSGTDAELRMSLDSFEHTWARSRYWSMVALPPETMAATADESGYVAAAAALERVSAQAAASAYRTALKRWPRNAIAGLGLGNAAYAQGDLALAEQAYRQATQTHPDFADAWNNLAQVLRDQGRSAAAADAARKAVSLGGPRVAQYQGTLDAIVPGR